MAGKMDDGSPGMGDSGERRMMGSLRDALLAAGRSEGSPAAGGSRDPVAPPAPSTPPSLPAVIATPVDRRTAVPSASEAAAEVRAGGQAETPQTRVVRAPATGQATVARTQLVRGKAAVARTDFHQDPVVAWLVVIGGPGLGAFRPIYEGNNTIGRAASQRIPIDFGDESISSEEQAYIRYDSVDRRFLLVPNLAKTNIVAVNDQKPTSAVVLTGMDVITMGRTQLVFVPFCGQEFDWAELTEMKG